MNTIQNKGATLDVLNLPSMTGIADPNLRQLMTNLIIELYKYQAESERKRIIERQQQGIALAKQQGKYHGRKPQYTQDDPRLQHAFKLYQAGMSDVDVARNTETNNLYQISKKIQCKKCQSVDCKFNPNFWTNLSA